VVRYSRLKALSEDESQPKNVRDFARAAQFYYKEAWDSAFAAYDVLRGHMMSCAVAIRCLTVR
jgi:soluble lytic murein transglycosylase